MTYYSRLRPGDLHHHHHYVQALVTQLLGYRLSNQPLEREIYGGRNQLMSMHNQQFNGAQNSAIVNGEAPVYVVCEKNGAWINATWVAEDCATSTPQCEMLHSPRAFGKERPPRIIFLGDSTIKHLAETFRTYFPAGEVTKQSDICRTIEDILMMERASY